MTQRLQAAPRVIFTEMADGGGLLLHLGSKMYFTLNETGVTVWKALSTGPHDRAALAAILAQEYECSARQAEQDLVELVDELIGEELVREL